MPTAEHPDLLTVEWAEIPVPTDDGATRHLEGLVIPDVPLPTTRGDIVSIGTLHGRVVVFAYPRTGRPGVPALVDDWDQIPGARGCTPQACAFRDLHQALLAAGATHVFGLSTQDATYQREAVDRLRLPFPLVTDEHFALTDAIALPTFVVAGNRLLKRHALIVEDGRVVKVFYPVFPPDRNAQDVLDWLAAR